VKKLRLIWFGKVWFWAVRSSDMKETGCKYRMDDTKHFDIHVESPAYDIDNRRMVSVMINVRGEPPIPYSELKKTLPDLNLMPIYEYLSQIPFDINKVIYLETDDYTDFRMHDCVWIHHFDGTDNIQIVPNEIIFSKELDSPNLWDTLRKFF
jgi:hypothetical protein